MADVPEDVQRLTAKRRVASAPEWFLPSSPRGRRVVRAQARVASSPGGA